MKMTEFDVIQKVFETGEDFPREETRWVIIDVNGKVIDDAQGYGYKTKDKATKAAWYKFKGGKNKIQDVKNWWKKNKKFKEELIEYCENNWKEIASGEDDLEEYASELAEKYKIQGFSKKFLKYL